MKRILLLFICLLISSSVFAQNPISTGMGGAGTSYISGAFAIGHNPAGLASKTDSTNFEILLPSAYFGEMNNGELYVEDFSFKDGYVSDADKDRILNQIEDLTRFDLNSQITVFALAYTPKSKKAFNYGFAITEHILGSAGIPADLVGFGLYGNTPNETYSLDDLSADMMWYRSFGATVSKKVGRISFGATFNYLQGNQYIDIDFDSTSLHTNDDYHLSLNMHADGKVAGAYFDTQNDLDYDYKTFPTPAGAGMSVDFGLQYDYSKKLRFGISFTDIGYIHWNSESARSYSMNVDGKIVEISDTDYIDSLFKAMDFVDEPTDAFTTSLTPRLTLGASYHIERPVLFREIVVSAETNIYVQEPYSPEHSNIFALGAKLKILPFLPTIMAGYGFTYAEESNISAGIGFESKHFDIYASAQNTVTLFSNQIEGSVAAGMRFKF
jgi:hypothetical protein